MTGKVGRKQIWFLPHRHLWGQVLPQYMLTKVVWDVATIMPVMVDRFRPHVWWMRQGVSAIW